MKFILSSNIPSTKGYVSRCMQEKIDYGKLMLPGKRKDTDQTLPYKRISHIYRQYFMRQMYQNINNKIYNNWNVRGTYYPAESFN